MPCACGKGNAQQTYTVVTTGGERVTGLSDGASKLLVMKKGGTRTAEKK